MSDEQELIDDEDVRDVVAVVALHALMPYAHENGWADQDHTRYAFNVADAFTEERRRRREQRQGA